MLPRLAACDAFANLRCRNPDSAVDIETPDRAAIAFRCAASSGVARAASMTVR